MEAIEENAVINTVAITKQAIRANRVIPGRTSSLKIPLVSILTSRGFWAILLLSLANDYGFYLILTEGPSFVLNVLKKDIKEVKVAPNVIYSINQILYPYFEL